MRVLIVTPELSPWVKTGGLGDVASALPKALRAAGADVRILVPGYPALMSAFPERTFVAEFLHPGGRLFGGKLLAAETPEGMPVWMIDCPAYYSRLGLPYQDDAGRDWPDNPLRFGLLSRTAAWLASPTSPLPWIPDILQCNDWQAALAPAYLRYTLGGGAATVVTIHNLSFPGMFPPSTVADLGLPPHAFTLDGVEFYGHLSFLKAGLQLADWITTVSPTYAREIQEPENGFGLDGLLRYRADRLTGILNGIDTDWRNPATDPLIPSHYDADNLGRKAANRLSLQTRLGLERDAQAPILGVVSRLTPQKGLDLLAAIGDALVADGAQLALLGSGDADLQDEFRALARQHPKRIGAFIGYDSLLAHLIEAGSDIFVMPSRFEPCGLGQMYALRYGAPPVVRRTGGLADTVVDTTDETLADGTANGFVFEAATPAALLATIRRAVTARRDSALWSRVQRNGMRRDLSWSSSARAYLELFRKLAPAAD